MADFITQKFQDYQRQQRQSRDYLCPTCAQELRFTSKATLVAHQISYHPKSDGETLTAPGTRLFILEAAKKAKDQRFFSPSTHQGHHTFEDSMALDTCSSVAQPNTDSQASQQDPPQKRLPPLSSNFYQNRQVRASLRSKQSLSYSQEQAAKAGYSRKDIPTKRLFDLDPEYPKVRASLGSKQSLFNSQEQAPKADHSRKASLHCHEASIEDEPSPVVKSSAEQAKQKILMDLDDSDRYPNVEPPMVRQPETRPISHEQLVVEVKGIYAGLTMVEAKCIDVDEKQSKAAQEKESARQTKLTNEQWQALIALHKTLLHEHHDFFLASQHPSASPQLSQLAAKYSMPARMWKHGIHAFLEVLRYRLPDSLDHMLAFIYIASSMTAPLNETVPTFADVWTECLGDLGRCRMANEDDDPRDREVWSKVARLWYSKAAYNSPNIGRLHHHARSLKKISKVRRGQGA